MARKPRYALANPADGASWLLLIHQLPPKPAYLRVKIWRRLQGLGAVSVKNSVYALPASEQACEDLQWLLTEIARGGGEGMICEASLVDGLSDQQVRGLFDAARDADYAQLAKELRGVTARLARGGARRKSVPEIKPQLVRLRRRLVEIAAIDFFGATGRLTVEGLLTELEARLAEPSPSKQEEAATEGVPAELKGKIWVTRRGVHIDRIACAWLIRRFIDADARFRFVAAKHYDGEPGELRFDMFKAEYTHEGDRCTFEVMLDRFGLKDAALRAVAEIVHDIDLKDDKFAREQVAGIAHVIAGLCMAQSDDLARIERGSAVFDDTYEYFRRKRSR
jgi:hypothetical protein